MRLTTKKNGIGGIGEKDCEGANRLWNGKTGREEGEEMCSEGGREKYKKRRKRKGERKLGRER